MIIAIPKRRQLKDWGHSSIFAAQEVGLGLESVTSADFGPLQASCLKEGPGGGSYGGNL